MEDARDDRREDGGRHREGLEVSRRSALQAAAAAAVLLPVVGGEVASAEDAVPPLVAPPPEAGQRLTISPVVNGRRMALEIDARTSLLDLLRERLGLTGAKKGCDHGQCGACTVHIGGRRVVSCLTMAAKVDGREVLTIEGLSGDGPLHPMQQAFIDHDALQCGYCTPGQIMSAVACVAEGNATSPDRIRGFMSGNVCRCGAYVGIVAAIGDAAARMGKA